MEFLFSISSKVLFGAFAFEGYKYYNLTNIEKEIKTAISVDTSYEQLPTNFDKKNILVAASITDIIKNKTLEDGKADSSFIHLRSSLQSFNSGRDQYFSVFKLLMLESLEGKTIYKMLHLSSVMV
jgi:hypothetical protein